MRKGLLNMIYSKTQYPFTVSWRKELNCINYCAVTQDAYTQPSLKTEFT